MDNINENKDETGLFILSEITKVICYNSNCIYCNKTECLFKQITIEENGICRQFTKEFRF